MDALGGPYYLWLITPTPRDRKFAVNLENLPYVIHGPALGLLALFAACMQSREFGSVGFSGPLGSRNLGFRVLGFRSLGLGLRGGSVLRLLGNTMRRIPTDTSVGDTCSMLLLESTFTPRL